MFFNQNGILNIDEAIMNKESFKKIMADGTVTEDEIKEQSDKVVGLFQEIEKKYSEEQLREIKDLLAETTICLCFISYPHLFFSMLFITSILSNL